MKLSVAIITKNEEESLGATINSIKNIADEIIVVDNHSTDNTVKLATDLGAKVFTEDWKGFGKQKQSCIAKCKNEWILSIDADEVVTDELQQEIKKTIKNTDSGIDVYKIKRVNYCFNKKVNYCLRASYIPRLFRKEKANINNAMVHERLEYHCKDAKLKGLLKHYTYKNFADIISKYNHFTDEFVIEKREQGGYGNMPKALFKLIFNFINLYFLKLGFLDGRIGLILSVSNSFYGFTKYIKLSYSQGARKKESIALVILTYNNIPALRKVLNSIIFQTVLPDEVVIADDGSTKETEKLITEYKKKFPIPLIHSWHEDRGFRIAKARNKAIAKTQSDYIVFSDGDLILQKNFVKDYSKIKRKNTAHISSRVFLTEQYSDNIVFTNNNFNLSFFSLNIAKNRFNSIRLFFPVTYRVKDISNAKGGLIGVYKNDIVKMNGFNENFQGWGREDTDFVYRLSLGGVKIKKLKFQGLTRHMYHNIVERENLLTNDKILKETIIEGNYYCVQGIDRYIK